MSLPKKTPTVWKGVMWAGVLVLLHAAVSMVHYKQFMRQRGSLKVAVPVDIYVEVGLGFLVTLLAALKVGGEFRPAVAAASATAVGMGMNSDAPSFQIFNHRGRELDKRTTAS